MVDRVNRIVLGVLGLVVAGAAVVGLLAGRESLTFDPPGELYRQVSDNAIEHDTPWTVAAIAGGVVLVVVGLFWAWRQVRPRSDGRISTTTIAATGRGRTTFAPVALAKALAQDLRQVPGVEGSKVKFVSLDDEPHLVAFVSIHDDVDASALRSDLEAPFQRACQVLDVPSVSVDLRLRPTDKVTARVA